MRLGSLLDPHRQVSKVNVFSCLGGHAKIGRVRTPQTGGAGAGVAGCITTNEHQELKCVYARQAVLQD